MIVKTYLQRAWQDVKRGHNIDVYVTVILSTIIALLSLFNVVNFQVVAAATLATLAFVSISLLVNRHSHEQVLLANQNNQEQISQALAEINNENISEQFFQEDYDRAVLPQLILSSRKAFLWGFAFTATVPMLRDKLEKGLSNGLEVKFLLIEPYSEAAKMAIHGSNTQDEDEFNGMINNSLDTLLKISKRANSGSLDVRVINYLPPFTVVAVDPHLPTGRMFVRVASFRMAKDKVPWFELKAKNDSKWFKIFVDQFNAIWQEAQPRNQTSQ